MGRGRWIWVSVLLVLGFSLSTKKIFAFKKHIVKKDIVSHHTELKSSFGSNKNMPEKYNLQCLYALSYFNELKNTKIIFSHKKLKTTMACRPRWDFIFRKKENRVYKVIFNSDTLNANKVTFNELEFNAQIGVLGHEFSHIIDYMDKSSLELILYGILYFSKKRFKEKLEKKVDNIAINKGLGWQIYDFSKYVLIESSANAEYKKYKSTYYYTPKEINSILGYLYPKSATVRLLKN